MRDGPAGGDGREALLAAVERGCAARPGDDDEGSPLESAVAGALAELLHPGTPARAAGGEAGTPGDGWRAVVAEVVRRAVVLADSHPACWRLATSSAVQVDDWVRGGTWASALRRALEREGAAPAAVRDAPVVLALHLFAVRPQGAGPAAVERHAAALAAFPHVTRLRALLSSADPACEDGGPAVLGAAMAAVERLLR